MNQKTASFTNPLYVALLHESMVDKTGQGVTTSLTLIDIHDIARSCRTFGVTKTFIAHPAPALRNLARSLHRHWDEGFGSTYNPDRKEALDHVVIAENLDEALHHIELECGALPVSFATSAKPSSNTVAFRDFPSIAAQSERPLLIAFGTGWGMSEELLNRFDHTLEPIYGSGNYNHLSVRSACAIILDRLVNQLASSPALSA